MNVIGLDIIDALLDMNIHAAGSLRTSDTIPVIKVLWPVTSHSSKNKIFNMIVK